MDLDQLAIIDWNAALKMAGNKQEIAEEILGLLVKDLSQELLLINELITNEDYPQLLHHVHRLHGAVCYSGLPRVKSLLSTLETNLKRNIMVGLPSLVNQLNTEVNLVLKLYSRQLNA